MDTTPVRKTYNYQLKPPREQEQVMEWVWRRWRDLYTAGWEERQTAWEKGGGSSPYARQSAHLPASKEVRPDYRALPRQVVQDVLIPVDQLDRAYQACFRRVAPGEHPGSPRFPGATRSDRFPSPQFGTGALLDTGFLGRSKSGRIAVRWSRPRMGTVPPARVRSEADGW